MTESERDWQREELFADRQDALTQGRYEDNYLTDIIAFWSVPPSPLDLDDLSDGAEALSGRQDHTQRYIRMMSWIRDHLGAVTWGDLIERFTNRRIEPGIIGLWLEQDPGLFARPVWEAAKVGYPELCQGDWKYEN